MDALRVYQPKRKESDQDTGLAVRDSFKSNSGLNYIAGVREFENMKIVEGVSKGTANIFLTSLMVFDKNGILIYDAKVGNLSNYSREFARQMVLKGLVEMLCEAAKKESRDFNREEAIRLIDSKLKSAYFQQSYKAALNWYDELCNNPL